MILTVFRSRLRRDLDVDEYERRSDEVAAVGTKMPGFVSIKTYQAEDGERLSLVVFETLEQQAAWAKESPDSFARIRRPLRVRCGLLSEPGGGS
jgi:heme-degrading monooxygenase HmoA